MMPGQTGLGIASTFTLITISRTHARRGRADMVMGRMKILVWGINYAPEVSGIAPFNAALCEFLAARGHDVTMLTTFSYYPQWKKRPEDRDDLWRTELINGVKVVRVWHYVPTKLTSLKRILHEASFLLLSFLHSLTLGEFDAAVVISPPLGLGVVAWLFSFLKRAPFVFHVQDLQPDAALSLGMLKAGPFTRALYLLENFAYAKAARVSGISRGMVAAFHRKKVPQEKIIWFPNGVAVPPRDYFPAPGAFREKHGIGPEYCLASYSGNIGAKQGLEILFAVAPRLFDHAIKIVICGDGARREEMEWQVGERKLKNLLLLPLQDDLGYRQMQVDTSISLITQQKGTGQFFFPSKLLSAMLFSKPVLAVADSDSELAHAVLEAQCGRVVAPGDADGLAAALIEMSSPARQLDMGHNGKKWVEQYAFDVVLSRFEQELLKLSPAAK
jgi:colanic acid biosynthesis glycosyl transferase WcaI